jgi:hypothetical protein
MRRIVCVGGGFDRADDRGFEGRVAFLEVHRDLRVADAASQGEHERPREEHKEDGERDDPERDDRGRGESERFESGRRREQREQRARYDHDGAPRREPHAPAIPHAPDDVDELHAMVHVAASSVEQITPAGRLTLA